MSSAKAPIARAIDEAVGSALVPSLRERAFRKTRRNWWRVSEASVRAVTVQSSWSNVGETGQFTVEFGVSYPSLGEDMPTTGGHAGMCCHRERLGFLLDPPHDRWWVYENAADEAERSALAEDLARCWTSSGLGFLDRIDDPRQMLGHLERRGGYGYLMDAFDLAGRLEDTDSQHRDMDLVLEDLRSDEVFGERSLGPGEEPLAWLAWYYAGVREKLEVLGREFPPEDLERVRTSVRAELTELERFGHRGEWGNHQRAASLIALGTHVGIDVEATLDSLPPVPAEEPARGD